MKKLSLFLVLVFLVFSSYSYASSPFPLAPGEASETEKGTSERATTVEAAAGTDTERYITPAGLAAGIAAISGIGANETYGSGWNADTGVPEKDDIYDYLHLLDTNDDGDIDTIDTTYWATKMNTTGGTFTGDIAVGSTSVGKNLTTTSTLGTELITWTDAGWNEDGVTWTFVAGVLTHVTGNTTAVTGTVTGALTVGKTVRIAITGTGGTDTATYTLGGNTGTTIAASGAIAIVDFLTTTVDSEFVITPANTCTVAITNISVAELVDATGDLTVDGNLTVRSPAYFNSPILANFGVEAKPTYSFYGDEDTGLFRQSVNTVGVALNAGEQYRFTTGGLTIWNGLINLYGDCVIQRDAAHTLAQRNSTNVQTFRLYTTYVSDTSYERLGINTAAGSITLAAETLDAGTDNIDIVLTPAGTGVVKALINDYEILPIDWAIDGTTAPDASETITSTNKIQVRQFQGGTANQDVQIPWQVPSDFSGTTITFRVIGYVTNATAPANTETVIFSLAGKSDANSEILSNAVGTAVNATFTADATYAQYDRWATAWSAAVSPTGIAAGETGILSLIRDQANDTYAQKIGVAFIEIKYLKLTGS